MKKGDVIIIKSIDRLGRNFEEILEQWRKNISKYEKYEGMEKLRDIMSTIVYEIMEAHTQPVCRADLGKDPRMDYMEVRRQVYESQTWYNDVWEEELTMYSGHRVTTPQQEGCMWTKFR